MLVKVLCFVTLQAATAANMRTHGTAANMRTHASAAKAPKLTGNAWFDYAASLEPTGVGSKCTTTCRKHGTICETFCEPVTPTAEPSN